MQINTIFCIFAVVYQNCTKKNQNRLLNIFTSYYIIEENAKKDYILFLKKHLEQAANIFLQNEEQEKLRWLAETFVTTKEEMDILLKQAASQEQAEKVSMLMDIKHQRFSQKKKKFSL